MPSESLPPYSVHAEVQAKKIGNRQPVTGYPESKLFARDEINLQSRARRRGRRARTI